MKRYFLVAVAAFLSMGLYAQQMKVWMDGKLAYLLPVQKIDSITFDMDPGDEQDPAFITVAVSDINAVGATVIVTPSNPDITYVYTVVPTGEYDEASLQTRYTKAFFDDIIEYYAYYGKDLYYGDLLYKGKDVYKFNDLTPETDYTVYAVGVDTVTFMLSTPIATQTFRTAKWEKVGEKELSFSNIAFWDKVDNQGWWQLNGNSETIGNSFYYITVSPAETETVEGNYTMEDMDLDYTFMTHYTVNGSDTTATLINFVEGLFEVKETETGAEMDAIVNGSDGYEYTLHVTGILAVDEDDYNWAPTRRKASARKVTVKRNKAVGIKKLNLPKR